MKFTISDSILNQYPETTIGYLLAEVSVEPAHPYVDNLKAQLDESLTNLGITVTNFTAHPHINRWQQMYRKDFGVKPSEFRSSVEALLRRILRQKGIWTISSVVDLYNCCSLNSLLPMGAYDLQTIQGNIYLRHGQTNDIFIPLGSQEIVPVHENHVVYADEEKVLCWLWNHKDSRSSAITPDTKKAIFFVDAAFHPQIHSVEDAVKLLSHHLTQIGCKEWASGVLNANYPSVEI
jgi:DNA/RNA-binding domain of Phe-tRNA-synthetase-like protein